jgi:hypothetical protein
MPPPRGLSKNTDILQIRMSRRQPSVHRFPSL